MRPPATIRRIPPAALRRAAAWLAGLCLAGALQGGWALYRAADTNRVIRQLDAGRDLPVTRRIDADPEARLARALLLERQNRHEEAEAILGYLAESPGPAQGRAAYDLGNLHLRRAVQRIERGQMARAAPRVQLAKEAYRQALRVDPAHFDAKYNLETALRLLPDLERVQPRSEDEEERPEEVKPWTTLPGLPRGLP